jgi:hypothetical protein
MRISFLIPLALVSLLAGCKTKTHVVMLGPADLEWERVPTDSVYVFNHKDHVLPEYQPIARVSVGFNYATGPGADRERVEKVLRKRAGKLGAHGIIITEVDETAREEFWEGYPFASATAIRFLDPPSPGGRQPVRSPVGLNAIAIAPLAVPEDLPVHDSTAQAFAEDIFNHLGENGFHPLPLGTWEAAWAEANPVEVESADPVADLKDEAGPSLERRTLRILVEDYGADGILYPDVEAARAFFEDDEAYWDGTTQKVGETRSTGAKALSTILNALIQGEYDSEEDDPPPPEGRVRALSLVVQIENAIGAHLYTGRGGIELLEGADFQGGIYIGEPGPEEYEIVDVPPEALFQRRRRIQRSVRIALEALVMRR